jgi:hypothetical protein
VRIEDGYDLTDDGARTRLAARFEHDVVVMPRQRSSFCSKRMAACAGLVEGSGYTGKAMAAGPICGRTRRR